jgi:hypothetical protein
MTSHLQRRAVTPYRTASPRQPRSEPDVVRFAELAHRGRRTRQAVSIVVSTFLVPLLYAPLWMPPRTERIASAETALVDATVQFGSTARGMPPVHAIVRWPSPPMADAERARYEQSHSVECADGCLWYAERWSWR